MSISNSNKITKHITRHSSGPEKHRAAEFNVRHYSIHTEKTYISWIKKFIHFHQMKSRDDLAGGEIKIEEFLTHLAVVENVAPSAPNQTKMEDTTL